MRAAILVVNRPVSHCLLLCRAGLHADEVAPLRLNALCRAEVAYFAGLLFCVSSVPCWGKQKHNVQQVTVPVEEANT